MMAISRAVKCAGIGVDSFQEVTLWQNTLSPMGKVSFMGIVDIMLQVTLGCVLSSEENLIGG
jgi:hypothetical protein